MATLGLVVSAGASHLTGSPATYTLTADFDEGTKVNVVTTGDEVKLDDTTTPFGFIWVAVSSKNTIVKINTDTGAVVGEFWSAPEPSGLGDPSRTTVDKNGSVWVGNRNGGSVVHIGLEENGQCVDRNGNSVIDTSTGLGDVRAWPGAVATDATDECIIHYTQTAGSDVRHVSVNADNDVWVSGINDRIFQLIDGGTGAIIRTEGPVGYGGYGGLIDSDGVIWSARLLLRWDTDTPPLNPLSGPSGGTWTAPGIGDSYGLCIDPAGNVWNTSLGEGFIRKYDPSGMLLGTFGQGYAYAQGCVVTANGDVWVAHSLIGGTTVGHLKNDGTYVGTVSVGNGPTGVAVDANGKVWATNFYDGTVSRIDPALAGGVGAVDLTTVALGGNTYNYSDMTGSTLIGAPDNGTYTLVHDTGIPGAQYGTVSWNASVVGDGSLTMTAATSADGVTFSPPVAVTNAGALSVPDGQYIRVVVSFTRATTGESPVLYDLTIATKPLGVVLDHFKCYKVKGKKLGTVVTLTDQFGTERVTVAEAKVLCNPVSKNGEPVINPASHLKGYKILDIKKDEFPKYKRRAVEVNNQFGTAILRVEKPRMLYVPASKSLTGDPGQPPTNLNHFKCYTVKGKQIGVSVVLKDQFETAEARVHKPVLLCNPVDKNGEGILATVGPDHLVCYSITPRNFKNRTVFTKDQFGPEQLKVIGPRTLCVPSLKHEIVPPPPDDDDDNSGSGGHGDNDDSNSGSGGHSDSDSDGADD